MKGTNHALIRAKTREISNLINNLKMYIDFKSLVFVKEGDKYSGIIIMFDEPIDINNEEKPC